MKKLALILFIVTFIGSFVAKAQEHDWIGYYEFTENGGKTAGGSPIIINHSIEIRESANGLMAIIQSSGFQSSANLICTTKKENDKLLIYFADYGDDNMLESFEEGDLLLTLEKKDDKILTYWGKFQPRVEANNKSGKVYFRKLD